MRPSLMASWSSFVSFPSLVPSPTPTLGRIVVMLSLLKYALAASPLLLQQGGAKPIPDMTMRQTTGGDRRGAVASESDICSRIGIELLEQGGNAADAVSLLLGRCLEVLC
jgi:hypothetical protein